MHVFLNTGSQTAPFTSYSASTPTIHAFASNSGYAGGVGGLAVANILSGVAGDIIVGSGIGLNAEAQVFNYAASGTSSTPAKTLVPLFSSSVTGGVSVAAGVVDGVLGVVFGAGAGAASQVDFYNASTQTQNQFTAFTGSGSNAAVRVAITQLTAGTADILVAQGPNGKSQALETFTNFGQPGFDHGSRYADGERFRLAGRPLSRLIGRQR